MRPMRQPVPGFEPKIVFGTRVETIKILCFQQRERMKSGQILILIDLNRFSR